MAETTSRPVYLESQAQYLGLKWYTVLAKRLSGPQAVPPYLDYTLISDCSHNLLESDNPSDFVAGLIIRICLSTNSNLSEVHVGRDSVTLARLHYAIRGQGALEAEAQIIAIFSYLLSVTVEEPPSSMPDDLLRLANSCLREIKLPSISGSSSFLKTYASWRCIGERHEMAYGQLLPPCVSTSFFIMDISFLILRIDSSSGRDSMELMHVLYSTSACLKLLTTEWLWKVGYVAWGIHALYGLLYHMDQQICSPLRHQHIDVFWTSFQWFSVSLQQLALDACGSIDSYLSEDNHEGNIPLETARLVYSRLYVLKVNVSRFCDDNSEGLSNKNTTVSMPATDVNYIEDNYSCIDGPMTPRQQCKSSVAGLNERSIQSNSSSAEQESEFLQKSCTFFTREEYRYMISHWMTWIYQQSERVPLRRKPDFWPDNVPYKRSSKLSKDEAKRTWEHLLRSQPLEGLRSILDSTSRDIPTELVEKLTDFLGAERLKD
ncbi:uncharacterized protein BP01DRAFT_422542 [Aspergillus saccharolyticus JOP 1030-1]|uniref:Uncharacterized protein n=1 Tax=Aspergillus saccharolyticus JOP 1030-1 TaxID=1450539 RepID=A0A318ZJM3_9EURO|nr:hypothetical protein BP01DRAFT_422542 [Aspergillus saccharolyticus JOP 1030-1]PYH46584.1 hypothetical protein BP01DRAFT_422542 [Aspergillus saccharolyticus JOP 1030-1]